jgi:ribosomal protein S18 acetylase RimI-like enzyme
MLAAEARCRAAGVTGLGLNVFTANTVALRLYDSLGYRVRMRQLWKSLV